MIDFHDLAIQEAREIQKWYSERSRRAAIRFRSEFNKTIFQISETPTRFPLIHQHYRYARIFGFPYMVVFCQQSDVNQLVVAIAHTSQQFGYWSNRE
jgi:plasmid stabilization system protein ParE